MFKKISNAPRITSKKISPKVHEALFFDGENKIKMAMPVFTNSPGGVIASW